ncbi:unnamed protein product, partial [Closterium sp. NIES-64]
WEDTGNRMRSKEGGGWWTGYVLKVYTHQWLNRTVTNRYKWWHWLILMAPDKMHNAHKGLVLFFVGAGLNPVNQVHIPGADEIFIRLAAPVCMCHPLCRMVVDLGILGVMLQQVPMMPISFKVGPPGIGPRAELIEEEITAHTIAMFLDHPDEWEWLTPLPHGRTLSSSTHMMCHASLCTLAHAPVSPPTHADTLAMFLDHPDEWEWLTPLPMAKSIIRALDATQLAVRELLPHVPVSAAAAHCFARMVSASLIPLPMATSIICALHATHLAARELLPHVPVEGFVAIGVSKRAGMSYFAAALDKRVVAFITYGYDLLNLVPNLQHMHDSLGGWPILLKFNSEYNISQRLHSNQYRKAAEVIDPYTLIDRMDMPKLLISASNDEFFLIDDSYYFMKDMPQPTQLKIVPNLYHMVIQNSFWAYDASISFFSTILEVDSSCASLPASSRPSLTWTRPNTSSSSSSSSSPSSLRAASVEGTGLFSQGGGGEGGSENPERKMLPWSCTPKLPAVLWPNLRWRFDWSTFSIYATSERKPLAVRAWSARTILGSKRRDFRMVIKQGSAGCVAPFQMPSFTYPGKFGMLCAQPIPYVTVNMSKPRAEDDGLWHFHATITDVPKEGYRAMFIEADFKQGTYKKPFTITTEAMVAPNTLPFSPCTKPECYFHFV